MKIYQNIVIGINDIGEQALLFLGKTFRFHNFELLNKISMKIHIEAGADGFTFTPDKGFLENPRLQIPGLSNDEEFSLIKTSAGDHGETTNPADDKIDHRSINRRSYADKFCQLYEKLASAVKAEWKHSTEPDLLREVSKKEWQIKGKKVFIIADLNDCASSAIIIPLIAALNYLMRNEKIPDIHWNIIGITGLDEDPMGKINSYSILKELEFLNKSPEPILIKLKTPPIDREVDLKGRTPQLYLMDAGARGVAPLKACEITQLAARYVFMESFYDAPFINPPDNELYFHSLGIGELVFPIKEILRRAAAADIALLETFLKKQRKFEEDEVAELSQNLLKEIEKKEPAKLPHYSQYQWEESQPKLSDFEKDTELPKKVKEFFTNRQKEHDKKVTELYEDSPVKNPYIRDLINNVDHLMATAFYGFTASRKLIDTASDEINKALRKVRSWNPSPPSDEEYFKINREMQDAVASNTPFPIIIFAFIFMLVPFDMALYDFLIHKYPSGDFNLYKIGIVVASLILSAAGAYAQKSLMESTLAEKFLQFAAIVQEYHKVHYYRTVKELIETFYLEIKHLIIGVNDKEKEQIRKEVRELEPLWSKLSRYIVLMEQVNFQPEVETQRFFDAPVILDSENEKELDGFFKRFLNRPLYLSDVPGASNRCPGIFDEINTGLPFWRDILATPEKRYDLFNKIYENRFSVIQNNIESLGLDVWKMIEKLGDRYFKLTAANLDEFSTILAKINENHLNREAQINMAERIIFVPGKGRLIKNIEDFARKKQFVTKEAEFLKDNMIFFQSSRFINIYKLANLNDRKYYENRLTPEEKRNLYINDIFLNAPDINYDSRTKGREES